MSAEREVLDRIEQGLGDQARMFRVEDGEPSDEGDGYGVLTAWVAVTAWTGVDTDGDTLHTLLVHRAEATPTWQQIGLLRTMLATLETQLTHCE